MDHRSSHKPQAGIGSGHNAAAEPADLRVEFSSTEGWRVLLDSERARRWARRSLRRVAHAQGDAEIRTTFAGVHEIVGKARREGYVSVYDGPYETLRF